MGILLINCTLDDKMSCQIIPMACIPNNARAPLIMFAFWAITEFSLFYATLLSTVSGLVIIVTAIKISLFISFILFVVISSHSVVKQIIDHASDMCVHFS